MCLRVQVGDGERERRVDEASVGAQVDGARTGKKECVIRVEEGRTERFGTALMKESFVSRAILALSSHN